MSSSYRFTVRLGPKDAELIAAIQRYPPGQRSVITRTALRAWLCGPETLQRLLEAVSLQQASPGPFPQIDGAKAPHPDLVADFLNDFLGPS